METAQPSQEKRYSEKAQNEITFQNSGVSRASSWLNRITSNFTVEVLVCLFGLGYYMPSAFVQNLILEKLCLLKYPAELCTQGVLNTTIEEELQQKGANILLVHHLMRQVPSCILCLFMGSWSDVYGRKFAIIVPLVGNALTSSLYLMNYYFTDWPAEYIMFASIPASLTGDYGGFFLGLPGFIMDTQPIDVLTRKLSIMDGMECITAQLGPLIGGQLYTRFRYPAVFGSCIVLHVLAAIFAFLKIKDKQHQKASWRVMLRDFFRFDAVLQSIKSVFQKRERNRRVHIIWLLVVVIGFNFPYFGMYEIIYFYSRFKLQWDVVLITYYLMLIGGCSAIGTIIILPMMLHFMKMPDLVYGILGNVAFIGYLLGTAFANDTVGMFCVPLIFLIAEIAFITQLSCLSKWVTPSEIGKIMSIFAILQAMGRNVGQILATQIYLATNTTFPGAYFVISAVFPLLSIFIYGWIIINEKHQEKKFRDPRKEEITDVAEESII